MSQKKIYIVGSANEGNVKLSENSVIYVANSAISRLNPDLDGQITHVASANILDPKIISQAPHLLERRKTILSRKPSELVIYPTFSRVCIADFNLEQIKYSPKKISHINKFQFWSMIYSGSRLATFKYSLFQEKGFIYNNLRFLKHLLGYPIAPFFLPSTGMLAL